MGAAPVRPFPRVAPHVALSAWARAALCDRELLELEALAAERDVTVGIVKRSRDHRYLARIRDGGQAIGRTPYGAALAVLGLGGNDERR